MRQRQDNQKGFIALISVILILSVMVLLIASASAASFYGRFSELDYENKKISAALAEGCIEQAMLDMAQNSGYAPNPVCGDCVGIGDVCNADPCGANVNKKVCRICSVNGNIIKTRAAYKGAYSNFTAAITPDGNGNFIINSWAETANYSGPACNVP